MKPVTTAILLIVLIHAVIGGLYVCLPRETLHPQPSTSAAVRITGSPIAATNSIEGVIQKSRLSAYDVSDAAYQIARRTDADLFDSYVSLYLPAQPSETDLRSVSRALDMLSAVPLPQRTYPFHIKMTFCEFYRFTLIPVLHFRKFRSMNLSQREMNDMHDSLEAALKHAELSGESLALIRMKLQDISHEINHSSMNEYLQTKQSLLRQIL